MSLLTSTRVRTLDPGCGHSDHGHRIHSNHHILHTEYLVVREVRMVRLGMLWTCVWLRIGEDWSRSIREVLCVRSSMACFIVTDLSGMSQCIWQFTDALTASKGTLLLFYLSISLKIVTLMYDWIPLFEKVFSLHLSCEMNLVHDFLDFRQCLLPTAIPSCRCILTVVRFPWVTHVPRAIHSASSANPSHWPDLAHTPAIATQNNWLDHFGDDLRWLGFKARLLQRGAPPYWSLGWTLAISGGNNVICFIFLWIGVQASKAVGDSGHSTHGRGEALSYNLVLGGWGTGLLLFCYVQPDMCGCSIVILGRICFKLLT